MIKLANCIIVRIFVYSLREDIRCNIDEGMKWLRDCTCHIKASTQGKFFQKTPVLCHSFNHPCSTHFPLVTFILPEAVLKLLLTRTFFKGSKYFSYKNPNRGFPGGAVVESLPANAGDMGSSPGLGRSHMPRSN